VSKHLSRYAPRAHRFDFLITLCVIGILGLLLLQRLEKVKSDIEKVKVKTELNNFRLAIAETWIHKNLTNQSVDLDALNESNPMLFIAEKPENYIGERVIAPSGNNGIWYFDTPMKRLIYVFSDGQIRRYKFVRTAGRTSASLISTGGIDLVLDEKIVN